MWTYKLGNYFPNTGEGVSLQFLIYYLLLMNKSCNKIMKNIKLTYIDVSCILKCQNLPL